MHFFEPGVVQDPIQEVDDVARDFHSRLGLFHAVVHGGSEHGSLLQEVLYQFVEFVLIFGNLAAEEVIGLSIYIFPAILRSLTYIVEDWTLQRTNSSANVWNVRSRIPKSSEGGATVTDCVF